MESKKVGQAIPRIGRKMNVYKKRLANQLEMLAEAEHPNGYFTKKIELEACQRRIAVYEIILADLATVRTALRKAQTERIELFLYGTTDKAGTKLYDATRQVLESAGLVVECDGSGKTCLYFADDEKTLAN